MMLMTMMAKKDRAGEAENEIERGIKMKKTGRDVIFDCIPNAETYKLKFQ